MKITYDPTVPLLAFVQIMSCTTTETLAQPCSLQLFSQQQESGICLDVHQQMNNNESVVHSHNGILLSSKENQKHKFCREKKIDGTGKHYYKQGNPDLERQISYVPFSLRFKSLTFQYLYTDRKKQVEKTTEKPLLQYT